MTTQELLTELKRLGLTQVGIARALMVEKGSVSNWLTGTRSMSPPFFADLRELVTVLQERVQAGEDVHQAIQRWSPTVIQNPGGITRNPHLGIGLPAEVACQPLDWQTQHRLLLEAAGAWLSEEVQKPLTAERLMIIRRLGLTIEMLSEQLQECKLPEQTTREEPAHDGD